MISINIYNQHNPNNPVIKVNIITKKNLGPFEACKKLGLNLHKYPTFNRILSYNFKDKLACMKYVNISDIINVFDKFNYKCIDGDQWNKKNI